MTRRGADHDFELWVASAREADIVAAAERHGARLRRSGGELVGPCPVCGGTDRFAINLRSRVFHCRGAAKGGDVIAMVQYLAGSNFMAACEDLTGRPPPGAREAETPAERREREERQARRAAEIEAAAARRAASEAYQREAERKRAFELWGEGIRIPGTPAAAYLAARGIEHVDGVRLRFAETSYWVWSAPARAFIRAGRFPTMLAAITSPATGRFAAIHMTYLDPAAPRKATVAHPDTGEIEPSKKIRGSKRGGVIALVGDGTATRLVMAEGIETTLSAREAFLRRGRALDGVAFWAGFDLGNIGGAALDSVPHPDGLQRADKAGRMRSVKIGSAEPDLSKPGIELPDRFADVVLIRDGDSEPRETDNTLRRGATRWRRPGRRLAIYGAPPGLDLNDQLKQHLAEQADG